MKQKNKKIMLLAILSLIALAGAVTLCFYNKKNYINAELVYIIPDETTEFYPMAYIFYHSYDQLFRHYKMIKKTDRIKNMTFDFDNYSYVIVCGKPIKKLYYSWHDRIFKDSSPSYNKPLISSIFVTIIYDENPPTGKIYIYRVKKNTQYRGITGD